MSSVELTCKAVKCRKKHRCDWCGEPIEKGDPAQYRSGVYMGDFYSVHMHPECWLALVCSDLGHEDEYYPMEQKRGETFEESYN